MMDISTEIMSKLERFCAFQERCEADVRKKMTAFPCSVAQREEMIRLLKENDFLNEERFVEIFIRSKIKDQWGKLKIRQALFAKKISPALIEEKMQNIDEDAYQQMLLEVIQKWKRLHEKDADDKSKLFRAVLTKGFEVSDIMNCIKS